MLTCARALGLALVFLAAGPAQAQEAERVSQEAIDLVLRGGAEKELEKSDFANAAKIPLSALEKELVELHVILATSEVTPSKVLDRYNAVVAELELTFSLVNLSSSASESCKNLTRVACEACCARRYQACIDALPLPKKLERKGCAIIGAACMAANCWIGI